MADSDETAASSPPPAGGAAPSASEGPLPLPKAPRVNPAALAQRREEAVRGGDSPASKITLEDLLAWVRNIDAGARPAAEPKKAELKRGQISKEKRKFHKFDPEAAKAEQLAAEARAAAQAGAEPKAAESEQQDLFDAEIDEEDEDREDDDAEFAGARMVAKDPRKLRRAKKEPRSLWSSVGVQVVVLLIFAAGFMLGRRTLPPADAPAAVKRPAPIPADSEKTPTILSAPAMGLIDQAVDAAAAGDAKKAAAVLDQVRHTSGHIDGLDYQLALLAFASGDFPSAMLSLNRSIAEGEEVGACYGLRGLIANQRGPARGLHDFEAATQSAPFDAKGFFYWGEALRRSGKPQEALIHLRQAVERASTPAEQANYQLKVRLTQIELGREKEFAPELAAEMALARPPGDWVLTAAAQDMHSGNFAAAAADLNRARQLMDPAQLSGALRDYFFQGYRTEVPLARIYSEIMLPSTPSEPTPTPAATPAEALSLTLTAPPGASPAP